MRRRWQFATIAVRKGNLCVISIPNWAFCLKIFTVYTISAVDDVMMHDTTRLYIMRLYIISYWRARRADQCDDNMVRRWYVKNDQDNAMAVIRGLLIDGHGCPFPGVSDKNKPTQLTSGPREHRQALVDYHLPRLTCSVKASPASLWRSWRTYGTPLQLSSTKPTSSVITSQGFTIDPSAASKRIHSKLRFQPDYAKYV